MTHRHQRGWLKKEKRTQGETWVLFFRTLRKSDGKRVENKIPIGLVKDFFSKSCAWAEVERQHLRIRSNQAMKRAALYVPKKFALLPVSPAYLLTYRPSWTDI
jgi:hypothetical protein